MGTYKVPASRPGEPGAALPGWKDDRFGKQSPATCGWLGETACENGTCRLTGTALVFAEGGKLKVCLTDRQEGVRCFVTATTWESLWKAVESILASGDGDWRAIVPVGKRH